MKADSLNGRRKRQALRQGGNDRLNGGAGNDLLVGGAGADNLNCGSGGRDVAQADSKDTVST